MWPGRSPLSVRFWIQLPSGAKANFAVAGGIKNGSFWGHLTYIDHGTGVKVKGQGVTAYSVGGTPTTRQTSGGGCATLRVNTSGA